MDCAGDEGDVDGDSRDIEKNVIYTDFDLYVKNNYIRILYNDIEN